jgi:hypothetical protein
VTRFYALDAADALVPDLAQVTGRLRDLRVELIGLRDRYREREAALTGGARGSGAVPAPEDPELRRLHLRMRGLVDQMQAEVAWLDERSIVLRDIPSGLLDLPALVAGRQVWLCWRLGEDAVGWWHELDTGFAGRRPLAELG